MFDPCGSRIITRVINNKYAFTPLLTGMSELEPVGECYFPHTGYQAYFTHPRSWVVLSAFLFACSGRGCGIAVGILIRTCRTWDQAAEKCVVEYLPC